MRSFSFLVQTIVADLEEGSRAAPLDQNRKMIGAREDILQAQVCTANEIAAINWMTAFLGCIDINAR